MRYYVFVKSSIKHAREECESKRAYVFKVPDISFNLSGPCELLFFTLFYSLLDLRLLLVVSTIR